MQKYEVIVYEQEDFDKIRDEMTNKRAAEILNRIPRGWFPYRLPSWSDNVTKSDIDNYEICCAIWKAIEELRR